MLQLSKPTMAFTIAGNEHCRLQSFDFLKQLSEVKLHNCCCS
jgi:hypothetical protein